MRHIKYFTIFLLILTSCASSNVRLKKRYKDIDSRFEPYIAEFIHESDGKITRKDFKNFTMGIRTYPNGESVVGTCHYGVNEVDISDRYWRSSTSMSQRLELIFHELGHCILKRGHTETKHNGTFLAWLERVAFKLGIFTKKKGLPDGCPASFMHPYVLGERCINKHFDYYMDELFERLKDKNYVEQKEKELKKCTVKPSIINPTKVWLPIDAKSFEKAKRDCKIHYNSCLKMFIKKDHLTYNTICE